MKRIIHRLPAVLAVITTALVLAACGSTGSSTAGSPQTAPATDPAATLSTATASPEPDAASEPAQEAHGSQITIKDFEYLPPDLEVPAGTEVTWTNEDFFGHTVTSGEPGNRTDRFDGTLGEVGDAEGETFSHSFDEPGTYPYFCRFHPDRMQAVVTVTQ